RGYSRAPRTAPSLYRDAKSVEFVDEVIGDVCDRDRLRAAIRDSRSEIVFHLAAQSLVRASYADPVTTFATNVLGTAHVLDAIRSSNVRVAVVITSDKGYENRESLKRYRETDTKDRQDQ